MKKILVLLAVFICAGSEVAAQSLQRVTRRTVARPQTVSVGPRTTYLKEGMNTEDVLKALGRPVEVSEREEDGTKIVSYVFERGEGRVLIAEFVGGLLVNSRVETRGEGVRAEYVNL